jgi:hypothetical protein
MYHDNDYRALTEIASEFTQELESNNLDVMTVGAALRVTAEVTIDIPDGWEIEGSIDSITVVKEIEL